MSPNPRVVAFFEQYERGSESVDLELAASQYADFFMFADPSGVKVVEKTAFLAALPRRQQFFKGLGHKSTQIVWLDEIKLDPQYTMARVRFRMQFEKGPGQESQAEVDSTFIFQVRGDSLQIVFQLEHQRIAEE